MSASLVSTDVADIVSSFTHIVNPAEKISATRIPFESLSLNDFLENIEVLCKYIMAQRREKINRKRKQKK